MYYTTYYNSPLRRFLLAADEKGLTGVWFEGQKYFADVLNEDTVLMKKWSCIAQF